MTPEEVRENLITAKTRLTEALTSQGNEKAYWVNMKAWFKNRISKEEFDLEARQLLPGEMTHLHNEFLLAVFTKCHSVGTSQSSKEGSVGISLKAKKNKRKLQAVKRRFDNRFVPAVPRSLPPARNLHHEIKQIAFKKPQKSKETRFPKNITFCLRSLEIPGMMEMNGRVAVVTWEKGLDDFADDVSQMVIKAIHVFLKNILSNIASRRSCYKVHGRNFKHHVGCTSENPYLVRDTNPPSLFARRTGERPLYGTKPTYDEAEQMAIESMGRAEQEIPPPRQAVNMYDLLVALQKDRALIPSHSVYGLCMERVISSLWHPDHDEIRQDEKFAKLGSQKTAVYG